MRTEDKAKFAELVTGMAEIYGREVTAASLRLWWATLGDHSLDDVDHALRAHVRDPESGQWMPKPADVIRRLEGSARDQEADLEAQAVSAWGKALEALRNTGPYQDCPIEDPRALAAIEDQGGWQSFCMMETRQLTWARKQFIDAYKCMEAPGTPRSKLGIHSSQNVRQIGEARSAGESLPKLGGAA
ncbi:DUF6475 domain-containing protein [Algiphilus aromaticivorans]|uniref:DUF6475 domain-containing protein n=1 Tax=Algiphilus aromaticivorans TaxID=382454 RepID=UPI0005C18202|nr:DUF6475 domain-containing protein [Algiphilus aromaticivorans]